jgi:hypothetical protein
VRTPVFQSLRAVIGAVLLLTLASGASGSELVFEPLHLVSGDDVARVVADGSSREAVRLSLSKDSDGLTFVALRSVLSLPDDGPPRSLSFMYESAVAASTLLRPAILVFGRNGEAWYRTGQRAALALEGMRPAAFSSGETGAVDDWEKVEDVWFGLVIQGSALGTVALGPVTVSSSPYRAQYPVVLVTDSHEQWRIGKDPLVAHELSTEAVETDGDRFSAMRADFTFAPGSHMFFLPSLSLEGEVLDGQEGLRLTYTASVPEGIDGLLVTLHEQDGSQYMAMPFPAPSEAWTTVTIPFTSFALGDWSRDENNRLDIPQIAAVVVGCHGTAETGGTSGTIRVRRIEFVPAP